jgi:hypothetical protein
MSRAGSSVCFDTAAHQCLYVHLGSLVEWPTLTVECVDAYSGIECPRLDTSWLQSLGWGLSVTELTLLNASKPWDVSPLSQHHVCDSIECILGKSTEFSALLLDIRWLLNGCHLLVEFVLALHGVDELSDDWHLLNSWLEAYLLSTGFTCFTSPERFECQMFTCPRLILSRTSQNAFVECGKGAGGFDWVNWCDGMVGLSEWEDDCVNATVY